MKLLTIVAAIWFVFQGVELQADDCTLPTAIVADHRVWIDPCLDPSSDYPRFLCGLPLDDTPLRTEMAPSQDCRFLKIAVMSDTGEGFAPMPSDEACAEACGADIRRIPGVEECCLYRVVSHSREWTQANEKASRSELSVPVCHFVPEGNRLRTLQPNPWGEPIEMEFVLGSDGYSQVK